MVKKKKDPYNFFLVVAGLLIGFFLGAAIIYFFNNRPADYHLAEAAQERLARMFQQQDPGPGPDPAAEQPKTGISPRQNDSEPASPDPDSTSLPADTTAIASMDPEPEFQTPTDEQATESITNDQEGEEFIPDSREQHSRGILEDEVRVKRDRLLGIIGFMLPTQASPRAGSESTRTLDSLLGGRQSPPFRNIMVEFWESPLSFTGYKMSKNSLILYGLDQIESVSLQVHEETIFLKYYGIFFPLVLTSDFLPLTAVEDTLLINKLERQWP